MRLCSGIYDDPVVLDDCQFHESAQLDQFDIERSISLTPVPGEFALMNYRCISSIRPPFKVYTTIDQDESSPFKVHVSTPSAFVSWRMAFGQALVQIRIVNEIPKEKASNGVEVEVPMPKCVSRVLCESTGKGSPPSPIPPICHTSEMTGHTWDFNEKTHMVLWTMKSFKGGEEFMLAIRATLDKVQPPQTGAMPDVTCVSFAGIWCHGSTRSGSC